MNKYVNRRTIIIFLVLVAAFWVARNLDRLLKFSTLFAEQPIVIDRTPILIKEIKTIAELVTNTAYDEVVVDSVVMARNAGFATMFNRITALPLLPVIEKELVLICKGKVLAGMNLGLIQPADLVISNDTIIVFIPKVSILDVIINPSGIETFTEKGSWTPQAVTSLKLSARQKLVERALNQGILQRSQAKANSVLENFFRNAGFNVVVLKVKN